MSLLGRPIAEHLRAYRAGASVVDAVREVLDALEALDDPAVLIGSPLRAQAMAAAADLDARGPDAPTLPLHGIAFVVKDNIDVAGVPTTCACPSFADVPDADATVIARLRSLGAIPVAKANLDQFATGLVGTRSPHGTPRNPLHAGLVPGGSSSGSAVAVARGLVPFALGTDTAGSGRVPAAMCGIVGVKPTIGRLPTTGVAPAVRRLDCVSVFASTLDDAALVADLCAGHDPVDPFSRVPGPARSAVRRVGVGAAAELAPLMEPAALAAYRDTVEQCRQVGFVVDEISLAPLLAAGVHLYGSALVAERTAAVGHHVATGAADLDPTVASIIGAGTSYSAIDAYRAEYRLAELRAAAAAVWADIDALLLPTTPGVATPADVAADPIGANARLGTFTTFVNVLDLAAVCVPCGERSDGLPVGVQLVGPAWSDASLVDAAHRLLGEERHVTALRPGEHALVVVGAHLSGMSLHHQLTSRHARLLAATHTAPRYCLHALTGTIPPKPGLERVASGGSPIAVEVWAMDAASFASFVTEIPSPLGVGKLELGDGSWVTGFVCEPAGLVGATDITHHGGWRAFLAAAPASP